MSFNKKKKKRKVLSSRLQKNQGYDDEDEEKCVSVSFKENTLQRRTKTDQHNKLVQPE